MNAIDQMLDGDEPMVEAIKHTMGVLAAEQFVNAFNNGCLHMSGLEADIQKIAAERSDVFYAPLSNLSYRDDH